MQWAIVNLISMEMPYYDNDTGQWSTMTAIPGTIINMVVYEEGSDWQPPENTKLEQVPDSARIGDTGY